MSQSTRTHATLEAWVGGCRCEQCTFYYENAPMLRTLDIMERRKRFMRLVDKRADDECWPFLGGLNHQGYGRINWAGWSQLAHRASYTLFVHPIMPGRQIDHMCRNRRCVNPKHLQAVSSKLNHENRDVTSASSSGFRNVYWDENRRKWFVKVTHNSRPHGGGAYADVEDAKRAARDLRNALFSNNLADRAPTSS